MKIPGSHREGVQGQAQVGFPPTGDATLRDNQLPTGTQLGTSADPSRSCAIHRADPHAALGGIRFGELGACHKRQKEISCHS